MRVKGKIFLAPMARVSVMQFRVLCRKYGADYVCTEMVNATALARKNKATLKLLEHCEEERPVGVQLFGANTEAIAKSAKIVKDDFDFIDFNLGCPSVSVMKAGAGAALLKRKSKVEEIVSKLVKTDKPVTVKMRTGWDDKHIVAVEMCKMLENLGVDAIAIHGRTTKQGYSGKADWKVIQEVAKEIDIPVIGNGNVFSGRDAKRMLKICDAVMIGRGAMGNPAIFREVKEVLKGERISKYRDTDRIDDFLGMGGLGLRNMKLQANYFTKYIKGGKVVREKIQRCRREQEITNLMQSFKSKLQP